MKRKGLAILAIEMLSPASVARKFAAANRITIPIAVADGRIRALFGFTNSRINYLVDGKGRVIWSDAHGANALRAILMQFGVKQIGVAGAEDHRLGGPRNLPRAVAK